MFRWPYKYGQGAGTDDEAQIRRLAIKAVQNELILHSMDPGPADGLFGRRTEASAKLFQRRMALYADGIVGHRTCRALFHPRVLLFEAVLHIPNGLFCGMVTGESLWDPGATGPNGWDSGLAQINLDPVGGHGKTITRQQAFDPEFAVAYSADRLMTSYDVFKRGRHPEVAWQCAVCQHNSPENARKWAVTGVAPNAQAADYVARVEAAC